MYIDKTLYTGRPADTTGRLDREVACYDLLDELGIPYERVDHDAADTIPACEEVETYLGTKICKNLSFAPPEEMEKHLGVTPGSATVLAMMNDKEHKVKLILDKSVAESQRFGCHPCMNTSTLALSMVDIRTKFLPHLGVEPLLVDLPDDRDQAE